jgi:uncharacterized membrane protein
MRSSRFSTIPYLLLLSATSVWVCGVWLAPLGISLGRPEAAWLYLFYHPVCHQLSERSFFLLGYPLAVCHRCFGLYVGFWLGVLLLPLTRGLSARIEARPRVALVFAVPMLADALWGGTALTRVATGFLAAFPFSSLVWLAFRQFAELTSLALRRRHEP